MMNAVFVVIVVLLNVHLNYSQHWKIHRKNRLEQIKKSGEYEIVSFQFNSENTDVIEFDAFDNHYEVELEENTGIPPVNGHYCYYLGTVLNTDYSRVSLSICDAEGVRGSITAFNKTIEIIPHIYSMDISGADDEEIAVSHHDEHMISIYHADSHPESKEAFQYERDNLMLHPKNDVFSVIGSAMATRRRLKSARTVDLKIVADWSLANFYSLSVSKTTAHVKSVINTLASIYRRSTTLTSYGITINLAQTEVFTNQWKLNPTFVSTRCTTGYASNGVYKQGCEVDIDKLLDAVRAYGVAEKPCYDSIHLLTKYDFAGTTIGYASNGMCRWLTYGINMDYNTDSSIAYTLAHEVGHNLGMNHDSGGNCGLDGSQMSRREIMCSAVGWGAFSWQSNNNMNTAASGTSNFKCLIGSQCAAAPAPVAAPVFTPVRSPSGCTSSPSCISISGVTTGYQRVAVNGNYNYAGCSGGKAYYKQGNWKQLFWKNNKWQIYSTTNIGWNKPYAYCSSANLLWCRNQWYYYSTATAVVKDSWCTTSSCGAFTVDEDLVCDEDGYEGYLSAVKSTGYDPKNSTDTKTETEIEWTLYPDVCPGNKPMYSVDLDELEDTLYIHFEERFEYIGSNETVPVWVMRKEFYGELGTEMANCEQEELADCVAGEWKVRSSDSDSLTFKLNGMTSVQMIESTQSSQQAAPSSDKDGNETTIVLVVLLVVLILVGVGVAVFFVHRKKLKAAVKDRDQIPMTEQDGMANKTKPEELINAEAETLTTTGGV